MLLYLEKQAQIEVKAQITILLFNKVFIVILTEYSNYNNVFLPKNIVKLPEYIKINDHTIKLEESKQLFFILIYSLKLVKLKMLKTYIETNLTNSFIQFFKSFARVSIFLIEN